jgi:hypothetical protein
LHSESWIANDDLLADKTNLALGRRGLASHLCESCLHNFSLIRKFFAPSLENGWKQSLPPMAYPVLVLYLGVTVSICKKVVMCDANEYPDEATIGDQRRRGKPEVCSPGRDASVLSPSGLDRLISCLAYEIYLDRGKLHGHDLADWLAAEETVLSRLTRRARYRGEPHHGKEAK